ncbi:MAG TPA: alpha/beta hydrolase-fold protein [Tepidisphaeraceae bacterium]|jgi:predicted peptidase
MAGFIRSIRSIAALFLCLSAVGCSSGERGEFKAQQLVFNGEKRNYSVYVPKDYSPTEKTPAILFLHGLFEGGNDGEEMTGVGIGPAIKRNPKLFKSIVIMAQTSGSWRDRKQLPLAMATLDDAVKKFNVDPDRISLTGLSTGGAAVWMLGAAHPKRFSALAPMCAHSVTEDVPKLTRIPVWAFSNSTDPFVPASNSKSMVEKINKKGGNAQLTIFSGFGHNCWDEAYDDEKFVRWLQTQRRKS